MARTISKKNRKQRSHRTKKQRGGYVLSDNEKQGIEKSISDLVKIIKEIEGKTEDNSDIKTAIGEILENGKIDDVYTYVTLQPETLEFKLFTKAVKSQSVPSEGSTEMYFNEATGQIRTRQISAKSN